MERECSKGQAERCRTSKSPNCTCACGGWNHGNQAARRKAEREEQENLEPSWNKGILIDDYPASAEEDEPDE